MVRTNIEFVGIAGVGKTTVVNELCKILQGKKITYKNISISNKERFLTKVLTTLKACYISLLFNPKSIKSHKNNTIKLASFLLKNNKAIGERLYLIDEGIFHRTREFQRNSRNLDLNQIIDKVNSFIHFPDYVVILEADAQVVYKRRVDRNRDKDDFTFDLIQSYVNNFNDTIEMIKYAQKTYKPSLRIIRIKYDANTTAEQAAEIIIKKINCTLKEL